MSLTSVLKLAAPGCWRLVGATILELCLEPTFLCLTIYLAMSHSPHSSLHSPCSSSTVIAPCPCSQKNRGVSSRKHFPGTLSSLQPFTMASLQQSFLKVAPALSPTSALRESCTSQRLYCSPQYFTTQFRSLKTTAHMTDKNATKPSVSSTQVLQQPLICPTVP